MDFIKFTNNLRSYGNILDYEVKDMIVKNTAYCLTQTTGYSPVLTGKNKNSITATVNYNNNFVEGEVASGTTYAVGLELGTIKRSATPYFLPALNDTEKKQEKDVIKILKNVKDVIKK